MCCTGNTLRWLSVRPLKSYTILGAERKEERRVGRLEGGSLLKVVREVEDEKKKNVVEGW